MALTALLAAVLLSQGAATAAPETTGQESADVAYEEMAQGQSQAAISRIRANRTASSDDPAALINLGTAHARMGDKAKAMKYFMAAITSENRYDLQLADGRWMDSRRAARIAMESLEQAGTLALR